MEDTSLPPAQSGSPTAASDSLDSADTNAPVASYSLPSKKYPIENLEVHREGDPVVGSGSYTPTIRSVPFSRRRATIVSLGITLVVVLITGLASGFFVSKSDLSKKSSSQQLSVPTQDVSFDADVAEDGILPELQGAENALLVNGDLIARGKLKVVSGSFTSTLGAQALSANQTITLPNASGVVCLDVNNCSFATQVQVNQLTEAVNTPADVLTVSEGGTGTDFFAANGLLVGNGANPFTAVTASGAGQCLVSTAGAPTFQTCPGGGSGSGVSSLNTLSGAITLQGTANQVNVATGAGIITLSTPQDIATTSNVLFNELTVTANADVNGSLAVGSNASTLFSTMNGLMVDHDITGNCTFGCSGINVRAEGTGAAVWMWGVISSVAMSNGGSISAAALYANSAAVSGTGTITENYGLYVASQTVGTLSDYGIYIQGADTYALWVDTGATRLDSTLEVHTLGATNTAAYLCYNSSHQLAACATGTGAAFVQGGNSFGAIGVLGTNDANSLQLETNNVTRLTIDTSGNATLTGNLTVQGVGTSNFAGNVDVAGILAVGDSASSGAYPFPALAVKETYTVSDSCAFGCFATNSHAVSSGNTLGVGALSVLVETTATPFTLAAAQGLLVFSSVLGSGSAITDNYGIYIQNQTAGTNDYGIYVAGADTYALWVDAGATRLDGNLQVQGSSTLGDASGDTLTINGTGVAVPNNLNFDTNTLFVDATNNRVGIGTATPGTGEVVTFEVNGGIGIIDDHPLIFSTNASKFWSLSPEEANNKFELAFQGSGVLAVNSQGWIRNSPFASSGFPDAGVHTGGSTVALNAWGTNGVGLRVDAGTYTDDSTAISGTATNAVFNSFAQATLAATNASVTTTNAATVYVQNSPLAGTNQTITNAYALWIDDGTTRFDGNVGINNVAAPNPLSLNTLTTADNTARLAVSTGATTNKGILVQGVASQTADLFQAQSSTGAVLASINSAGDLSVRNATINGHIITANSSGSTTVVQGAAANCSATGSASISGNDTAGTVTINTSTGTCAPGVLATVTFSNAFGTAPRVIMTPANGNGATLQYYNGATNTTTFTIDTGNAAVTSSTYLYNYHVMQ